MARLFTACILLLFAMVGCSSPGEPPMLQTESAPSEVIESNAPSTPEQSAPSDAEQPQPDGNYSDIFLLWSDTELLSVLPDPKDGILWEWYMKEQSPHRNSLVTCFLTEDEILSYIQEIKDLGFTVDSQTNEVIDGRNGALTEISYSARDGNARYVTMWAFAAPYLTQGHGWNFEIHLWVLPDETAPPGMMPNLEEWDANLLRSLVPAPNTEYWTALEGGEWGYADSMGVQLHTMSLKDIQEYGQQLRDTGCFKHISEKYGMASYRFSGEDSEGNIIVVRYDVSAEKRAVLSIYPPSSPGVSSWTFSYSKNEYIPEPAGAEDWELRVNYSQRQIALFGMEYSDALAYIEELKTYAKNMNLEVRISELDQRDEEQFLKLRMLVTRREYGQNWTLASWYLIYDPNDPECPCKLVS